MKALGGTAPAVPAVSATSTKQPDTAPPIRYAAVTDRDASGAPTHIATPGPLAGGRVALYARRADGSPIWAGDVMENGEVKSDGQRGDVLRAIRPGTKIIAATDMQGRVLALTADARMSAPSKAKPRTATPARINTRSKASTVDRYAPDPGELLISGHVGRVVGVR